MIPKKFILLSSLAFILCHFFACGTSEIFVLEIWRKL